MKSAIITGPTGLMGVALTNFLLSQGFRTYAIIRPSSVNVNRLPCDERLKVIECPLSSLSGLDFPYLPESFFFHLGWDGSEKSKRNDACIQAENIQSTLEAIKLAHKIGCSSFVFAGSQAEYGRVSGIISPKTPCHPESAYGIAKLCAESLGRVSCKELDIKFCSARIFSIFGKYDGTNTLISYLLRSLKSGVSPSLTRCEQKWNYLYVKDAVRAMALIAEKGRDGQIYNIASNDNRPLFRYVEEIRMTINPDVKIGYGEKPYEMNQVMNLRVKCSLLKKDIGFEPKYTFVEGIKEMLQNV